MSSVLRNVLFLDDFDEVTAVAGLAPMPDPVIVPATYLEQDLLAARAQAFGEGHRQGMAEAPTSQAAEVAATIGAIATSLHDATAEATRIAETTAEAMLALIIDIIAVGYPSLRERYGEQEVCRLLRMIVPKLALEPKIVVHVNPSLAVRVAAELEALAPGQHGRLSLMPTPSMLPGDMRVVWQDGMAVRDTATAWPAIVEILKPLGLLPDPASTAHAADTG